MTLDTIWNAALASLEILDDSTRLDMVGQAERAQVPPGTVIIAQDEADDRVFLLLQGRARVVLLSENGQEIWLDAFESGAVFGELAALTGSPRISGIVAETDCDLAVFEGSAFFGLVRRHGEIGLALSRLLARRVQHTTQRMFELSALSAPGRIYAAQGVAEKADEPDRTGRPGPARSPARIELTPGPANLRQRPGPSPGANTTAAPASTHRCGYGQHTHCESRSMTWPGPPRKPR
jgi:CRP-like cAMP-binding protein